MKKVLLLLTIVGTLTLQSCASIIAPSQKTYVKASEKGAVVTVNGNEVGMTPLVTKLKADDVVEISKKGFDTKTIIIGSKFNAVSILNGFSILGWGIDLITGAVSKPEFKSYKVTLDGVEMKQ